jgi:hypothetical protein
VKGVKMTKDNYSLSQEICNHIKKCFYVTCADNIIESSHIVLCFIIKACIDNGYYKTTKHQFNLNIPKIIQVLISNKDIDDKDMYVESNDFNLFNKNISDCGYYIYLTLGDEIIDSLDVFWPYKGTLSPGKRFKILERDGFKCGYCGIKQKDTDLLHVDHIYPRKHGGDNNMDNLIAACIPCNLGKSGRIINTEGVKHVLTKSRKSNDSI